MQYFYLFILLYTLNNNFFKLLIYITCFIILGRYVCLFFLAYKSLTISYYCAVILIRMKEELKRLKTRYIAGKRALHWQNVIIVANILQLSFNSKFLDNLCNYLILKHTETWNYPRVILYKWISFFLILCIFYCFYKH